MINDEIHIGANYGLQNQPVQALHLWGLLYVLLGFADLKSQIQVGKEAESFAKSKRFCNW